MSLFDTIRRRFTDEARQIDVLREELGKLRNQLAVQQQALDRLGRGSAVSPVTDRPGYFIRLTLIKEAGSGYWYAVDEDMKAKPGFDENKPDPQYYKVLLGPCVNPIYHNRGRCLFMHFAGEAGGPSFRVYYMLEAEQMTNFRWAWIHSYDTDAWLYNITFTEGGDIDAQTDVIFDHVSVAPHPNAPPPPSPRTPNEWVDIFAPGSPVLLVNLGGGWTIIHHEPIAFLTEPDIAVHGGTCFIRET